MHTQPSAYIAHAQGKATEQKIENFACCSWKILGTDGKPVEEFRHFSCPEGMPRNAPWATIETIRLLCRHCTDFGMKNITILTSSTKAVELLHRSEPSAERDSDTFVSLLTNTRKLLKNVQGHVAYIPPEANTVYVECEDMCKIAYRKLAEAWKDGRMAAFLKDLFEPKGTGDRNDPREESA